MLTIPLQATPSQSLSAVLGGQNCQINVYQKSTGMYLDLYVSNSPIITATICLDRVRLVRETYLGFIGDLAFADTQGTSDPVYTGLGSRFVLLYLEASDL
ncbi:phage baseplate plug family protein [Paraburkholderia gardini]|uniref:phage baseplate plug family protein n=1 Tax=Paraburkholderia gardini TaxID=2823469 RepID=UPI001E102CB1|nr:hypothetical protein [Paraburkholderia gardini]CAG4889295.1 hypothetical protein R69919_00706 [Paraburkholderia gardini]